MKGNKSISVGMLAKLAGKGIDETLLLLWDQGFEDIIDGNNVLVGQKLLNAKHILGIPGAIQLTSLTYWQSLFGINENELRTLLANLKVAMSPRGRKLPTGAIKILKSEAKRRNRLLQIVEVKNENICTEVSEITLAWKTIGKKVETMSIMAVEEILRIHYALVQDFSSNYDPINPAGPRDLDLLASALYRQETSIGSESKYESVEMKGAALLHSLIHNHPFHNGNKRTALVSLLVFMDKNQLMLVCGEKDLFKFVLNVAQHRIVKEKYVDLPDREVMAIAEWICANSRSIKLGDRVLPFRKLKHVLNRYDCKISHSDGGTNYKITRKIKSQKFLERSRFLTTNLSVRNEGLVLQVTTIKKARLDLELDEEHGIDSAAFYDEMPTAVDDFIVKYRKTLVRLSKL